MDSAEASCDLPAARLYFRLRHVGSRDFAGGKAVACLAQRNFEHIHVAALELKDGGIAQRIHVGGGAIEQNGLIGRAQSFARGEDLPFRLPRAVSGLKSIVEGLCRRQAEGGSRTSALWSGRTAQRRSPSES